VELFDGYSMKDFLQPYRFIKPMKPLFICRGLLALLSLIVAPVSWASTPLYQNLSPNYYSSDNPPPNLDTLAFDNESIFSIDFGTFNTSTEFYQTLNTLNYTNNGSMLVDTGFNFDLFTTNVVPDASAATFYNPGSIVCGSSSVILSGNLFFFESAGKFMAWATNIINSGSVDVGVDGLIAFSGQNVDLSRSLLTIENNTALINNILGFSDTANVFSLIGAVGVDTNADWNPGLDLTSDAALSSGPNLLFLNNSTSYIQMLDQGPSNIVIRAVFIQNTPTNMPYSVYFGPFPELGSGDLTVAWAGNYVNPATGLAQTNYLYLNDDAVLGASTNARVFNGVPNNFTFTGSTTPLISATPAPAGFQPVFFSQFVTNPYSYLSADLIATTIATNTLLHTNVSALAGRVVIAATNELNMASVQITGANYLSVTAPNQFDGSAAAQIAAAYSDLHLGRLDGTLTITNLLESTIPIWNGPIQAWSTRLIFVDATGVTNDYRILLVANQASPLTQPQVQNLTLNATNNLVISDQLNVFGAVSINSQNLTLSTNGPGNGASSLDGELNISAFDFSWNTDLPDLVNLTNNGAIRLLNSTGVFVGTTNTVTVLPPSQLATASGTLAEVAGRSNVQANDGVTIGTNRYAFVKNLANSVPNQVLIASTFDGSLDNLLAAIDQLAGSGTTYSSSTTVNPLALAEPLANHSITVVAVKSGSSGNSIVTTTTSTNLTWNGNATLTGGSDYFAGSTNIVSAQMPYQNMVNNGLIADLGSTILANNFVSSGTISNDAGSFSLQSVSATLTNGLIYSAANITLGADTLVTSNLLIQAGRSLTLQVTNYLTDGVPNGPGEVTNGNVWVVGGASSAGLSLTTLPEGGLLGTTITNIAPFNKNVVNIWAGKDFGVSAAGFTNNAAIGRLIMVASTNAVFTFSGTGVSNAVYVDDIEFVDQATNRDEHGDPIALTNTANMVIYYAQALFNGISVAELLNHANNNHLRWVPQYVGHYSSEELFYNGTTNIVNAALANSPDIDSNGNGIPNGSDPSPFFISSQVDFTPTLTNLPPWSLKLRWQTIPEATNLVQYTTNLLSPAWVNLTNFSAYYYSSGVPVPGVYPNGFVSPQIYPGPATNVWVYDAITNSAERYYRVLVNPNATLLYGP
jgi:hypothetical protein